LIVIVLLGGPIGSFTAQASPQVVGGISPGVRQIMQDLLPGEQVRVIVYLRTQPDAEALALQAGSASRPERRESLVRGLQVRSSTSQKNIQSLLASRQRAGLVSRAQSFWIFNGLAVSAEPQVIEELGRLPEVAAIEVDRVIQAPEMGVLGEPSPASAQSSISLLRVPDLWTRGDRGAGVVVASLDTGVDGTHPDLAGRWRGGSNSWFDPYLQHAKPADVNGHGTWTMGVMVGGSSGGIAIGVAPDAQWIAAKIFDDQNLATISGIHMAFQWVLDPDNNPATDDAPDVVNNSWGFSFPGCDLTFQDDLRALRAAGILPIFAAGNSGPEINTSTSPANNPEAFSVGATDSQDGSYLYSSRGMTDCGQPASIFPKVTAPGVSIYSSSLNSSYAYSSGTSLAAPHAAGILALILSARPGLSVAEQERILTQAVVDLGPVGADNTFGNGRLDAWKAYVSLGGEGATELPRIFLPLITH